MQPLEFKMLVPVVHWLLPLLAPTKFSPGHDARIEVNSTDGNAISTAILFKFNAAMDCRSITQSISDLLACSLLNLGQGSPAVSMYVLETSKTDFGAIQLGNVLESRFDGAISGVANEI